MTAGADDAGADDAGAEGSEPPARPRPPTSDLAPQTQQPPRGSGPTDGADQQ